MVNPRTIARLQARIQERAAHCLQFEIADPRAVMITVTRVELAKDLTSGRIYYSVLGGAAEKSKAEHMLDSAAGFIQRQIARVLDMRRMPHLRWIYDESIEQAMHLDQVIKGALERDKKIQEQGSAPEDDGDEWQEEYESFAKDEPPPKKPDPPDS
jgi:ribosome-binding factor A